MNRREKESQTINLKIEGSHRWAIASGKELRQNGARQFKLIRNEPMNSLKRKKKTRHADLHCPIHFTNTREKIEGGSAFWCELLETVKLYEIIVNFSILEENLFSTQIDFFSPFTLGFICISVFFNSVFLLLLGKWISSSKFTVSGRKYSKYSLIVLCLERILRSFFSLVVHVTKLLPLNPRLVIF